MFSILSGSRIVSLLRKSTTFDLYFGIGGNSIFLYFHLYSSTRLRCGEVEAKPTFVALSPGSGKKSSTGESDGLSDYENSTSYEDTDGDTDGERLVTEKLGLITGRSDDVCNHVIFLLPSYLY